MAFTGKGGGKFHEITREIARGANPAAQLPAGTDPSAAFGHFAIVFDNQIKSFPYIDFNSTPDGISGSGGARITGIGTIGEARTSRWCSRRRAAGQVPHRRPDDRLRDARHSLHWAVRAAIVGLLVVALPDPSTHPGRRRGARPRHLRGPPVRGAPALQRDADAAGLRVDPHDRRRSRREHRHLRTHQGGVPRGQSVRAAVAAGYQKGFSTIVDANVVTASRPWCCSPSPP
jgi:hypothetical protein